MSPSVAVARRIFLVGAAGAACNACGHSALSDIPPFVRTYMMKGPELDLTRADIDKIPYASLAVRMVEGPQALLILGRYDGDELNWISADREVIVTRRGRVVKTYGLPQDVRTTVFLTKDPVGGPSGDFANAADCVRTIDLEPQHRDGIVVRSSFSRVGTDAIDILGERFDTDLWQERAAAADLDWQFTNRYWIDRASGYVWKSVQVTAPDLPPLEIQVYRRAA